jgi:hypothetical protein
MLLADAACGMLHRMRHVECGLLCTLSCSVPRWAVAPPARIVVVRLAATARFRPPTPSLPGICCAVCRVGCMLLHAVRSTARRKDSPEEGALARCTALHRAALSLACVAKRTDQKKRSCCAACRRAGTGPRAAATCRRPPPDSGWPHSHLARHGRIMPSVTHCRSAAHTGAVSAAHA